MVQVYHLNCVEIQSPIGARAIGHCLLLQTKERLVLIDTGIGLLDTQQSSERVGDVLIDLVGFRFNEEWTAYRQIEKMGLDPATVTDCVLSHLDNDHAGGLADFPNATVHVAKEEYDQYRSSNPRYLQSSLAHEPKIITYEQSMEEWFSLPARRVDLAIDTPVFLIPLFGHTLGHCGIAVQDQDRWIFYIGDAYYLRVELTNDAHPVTELAKLRSDDNELRIASLQKIRDVIAAHPEITVFGYHDPEEFPLL